MLVYVDPSIDLYVRENYKTHTLFGSGINDLVGIEEDAGDQDLGVDINIYLVTHVKCNRLGILKKPARGMM